MAIASGDLRQSAFFLVLAEAPLSQQAKLKRYYQQRVHDAAVSAYMHPPFKGEVYIRITYCQFWPPKQDIDNIIKPIVDALKGVVFPDDSTVRQCSAERIFLDRSFTISDRFRSAQMYDALTLLLAQGAPDILCIEVGAAPEQAITFGSIREGTQ